MFAKAEPATRRRRRGGQWKNGASSTSEPGHLVYKSCWSLAKCDCYLPSLHGAFGQQLRKCVFFEHHVPLWHGSRRSGCASASRVSPGSSCHRQKECRAYRGHQFMVTALRPVLSSFARNSRVSPCPPLLYSRWRCNSAPPGLHRRLSKLQRRRTVCAVPAQH